MKRKLQSHTTSTRREKGRKWLDCKVCGIDGGMVGMDISAFTCARCVAQQTAPPEARPVVTEKRPRGWHFMDRYVSPSGKIYHRGVEVNESISSDSGNVERNAKPAKAGKSGPSNGSKRKRTRGFAPRTPKRKRR